MEYFPFAIDSNCKGSRYNFFFNISFNILLCKLFFVEYLHHRMFQVPTRNMRNQWVETISDHISKKRILNNVP